jgi:hypothetical protein
VNAARATARSSRVPVARTSVAWVLASIRCVASITSRTISSRCSVHPDESS